MGNSLEFGLHCDVDSPVDESTWSQWFSTWLDTLSVDSACELSLCLTSDERIRDLNRDFRQIDQPTDVLAFAAEETPLPSWFPIQAPVRVLGDIVISVPTAQTQAKAQGHSLVRELAWLASHGLLHLLGWDHPDEPSLERMLDQQQRLLTAIYPLLEATYGN